MVKVQPNTAIFDLYVISYYGILCIEDKTTGLDQTTHTRKVKVHIMKRYDEFENVMNKNTHFTTHIGNFCKDDIVNMMNSDDYIVNVYCRNCGCVHDVNTVCDTCGLTSKITFKNFD